MDHNNSNSTPNRNSNRNPPSFTSMFPDYDGTSTSQFLNQSSQPSQMYPPPSQMYPPPPLMNPQQMDPQTYFHMQQVCMFQQQQMAVMQHQQQSQTQQPPQATQSQPQQSEDGPSQGRVGGRGKGKTTTTKASRTKWPHSDEVLMAEAIYECSTDSVIATNQNTHDFWFRVQQHYSSSNPKVPRDQNNLKAHWHMVKSKVARFNELYLSVKSSYSSGWSDDMWLLEARQRFNADQDTIFKYEHIWNKVKDKLKYNSVEACAANEGPKRNKSNKGGYTSSHSSTNFGENEFNFHLDDDNVGGIPEEQQPPRNEDEPPHSTVPTRPPGRKAAKAAAKEKKNKGTAGSSSTEESRNRFYSNLTSAVESRQEYLDQLLAIEKNKMKLKYYKLVNMDTSHLSKKKTGSS
ncbi:hypothetical protein SSX86_026240 [Deinandra increscens subsp. villosa]|uniref:No apical meristem-associated C-terminal domain-containing protein n=1 Tax=Deinandra increscens subsp. villosa TaxID=3103831 RepID=A0AAP0CHS5_9ASTR